MLCHCEFSSIANSWSGTTAAWSTCPHRHHTLLVALMLVASESWVEWHPAARPHTEPSSSLVTMRRPALWNEFVKSYNPHDGPRDSVHPPAPLNRPSSLVTTRRSSCGQLATRCSPAPSFGENCRPAGGGGWVPAGQHGGGLHCCVGAGGVAPHRRAADVQHGVRQHHPLGFCPSAPGTTLSCGRSATWCSPTPSHWHA